jgi:hypothetical protein
MSNILMIKEHNNFKYRFSIDSLSLSTRQSMAPLINFHSTYKRNKNNNDLSNVNQEQKNSLFTNNLQSKFKIYHKSPRNQGRSNDSKSSSPVLQSINEK